MRLELIDSISSPGNPNRPNEDAFAHADSMAVVFDGVTMISENLMPGESDAAWLARFSSRRLAAHSLEESNPRDWIKHAAEDAAKSFTALRRRGPKERYEIPFASLMLTALGDDTLDAYWLGDCAALVRAPDGNVTVLGETFDAKAREREFIVQLAAAQGMTATATLNRGTAKPELMARRNRINTGKGPWLFAPDARVAKHAQTARVVVAPGAAVLIASDGFLALATDYDRHTPAALVDAALSRGLSALGEELRTIEAGDPEGVCYPRFKTSDDATALILRVVA